MIILIVEKSDVYSDYLKSEYLNEWNVSIGDVKKIEKLDEAGGKTLFGEAPPSILTVSTPAKVKELVKDLENAIKKEKLEEYIENGLIIIAKVNRVSTKKLETIVKNNNGKIEVLEKNENIPIKILNTVHLTSEVRNFLLEYVGDDFESLIPLVRILKKSPPHIQKKATIESVYLRLPKPPGSVPPWEVENALFEKDLNKAIDVFRRIDRSSSFLVVLSMLKNKFMIAYRIAALLAENPNFTDVQITKILNMPNNYYYKKIKQISIKYKIEKLEKIVELLIETENNVKGAVNIKGSIQMEVSLIKLNQLLK